MRRIAVKDTDLLTNRKLRDLLQQNNGPCLSIYIPTHRKGTETQQDPIRLKNLLRSASDQLKERGLREKETRDFLAPIARLVDESLFWQHQSHGLALFRTPGRFDSFRLPLHFEEFLEVSDHFHVKPLMPVMADDGRFTVLALSQRDIRLLRGSRHTFEEINLEDLPRSYLDAIHPDAFEKSVQFHTRTGVHVAGGDRAAIFHGHGSAGDDALTKKIMVHYFRRLDDGVRDYLGKRKGPLVLAGVKHIRALYREASHYGELFEEGIDGNPEKMSDEDLHYKAWEIVAPMFRRERLEAKERCERLLGADDSRVLKEIEHVVPNAFYRRVSTLFYPVDVHYWGSFNPEEGKVDLHPERQPGDEDLLDLAVMHTLRNGGTPYAVQRKEMPAGQEVAAILFS